LQFDIEGACADAAPIHRAKNLDVADGVEAESFRNACFHQLDDAWHGGFGIVRLHEVEIAIRGRAEIGNEAVVDAVSAGDDAALRGLPEHFGQAHHRHRP
jgi:hypothetical protein